MNISPSKSKPTLPSSYNIQGGFQKNSIIRNKLPTYVSSEYLSQVNRIRINLNKYKSEFLSLTYIDGTGREHSSSYNIWINLCLITSKIRPAFMVQWIDYLDPQIYQQIMMILTKYRDSISTDDLDYRLLFLNDPQGVIVTTYYTYYKQNLFALFSQYVHSNYNDELLLGRILGYPAAGEIISNKSNQYIFSIYVMTYGSGIQQIMANIYYSSTTRCNLYTFFNKVTDSIHIYDSDSHIVVEDTQGYQNMPISDDKIFHPFNFNDIIVNDIQRKNYKDFISSPDRGKENWNTDFDRIFELGYLYH